MAFGPAPGDIERVRAMGLARYIDEQLQPQKLGDAAMRERLAKFETLTMTSRDLGERYATLEELRRELQLAAARGGCGVRAAAGDANRAAMDDSAAQTAAAQQPGEATHVGRMQPDAPGRPGAARAGGAG